MIMSHMKVLSLLFLLLLITMPVLAVKENFSDKYKDTLTVFGNANMDDVINQDDITYVRDIIRGSKEKTQFADANNDGLINNADITQIEQIISGNENTLYILDMNFRTVAVPMPVEKIVSASRMDSTRTLIQLGVQDKIVGGPFPGSKFSTSSVRDAAPELEGLPDPGSFNEINVEQVLALKPDVMFVVLSVDADLLQDQTKVPTIAVADGGDYWTTDILRIIGAVTGKDKKAKDLISYTHDKINEISQITSKIPDAEKPVVYSCGPGGGNGELPTVRKSSGDNPMVIWAGGKNVEGAPESKPGGVEVSKEQIIKWNPDVITVHGGNKKEIETILSDPDLQMVNAIKNKKVYSLQVAQNGAAILGEKLAQVGYLAKLLHPDEFRDLNVEKNGNDIMKHIYGVDGLYTNMINAYDLYQWN